MASMTVFICLRRHAAGSLASYKHSLEFREDRRQERARHRLHDGEDHGTLGLRCHVLERDLGPFEFGEHHLCVTDEGAPMDNAFWNGVFRGRCLRPMITPSVLNFQTIDGDLNDGEDQLFGNNGNDHLFGGAENDIAHPLRVQPFQERQPKNQNQPEPHGTVS